MKNIATKIYQQSTKHQPKVHQKSTQIDAKSLLERLLGPSKNHKCSKTTTLVPLYAGQVGAELHPKSILRLPKRNILSIIFWIAFGDLMRPILIGSYVPRWSKNQSENGFKSDYEENSKLF